MIRKGYCPKREGHGVDTCEECQFYGDDCDGDEEDEA
jgi:hypothetical protein